MNQKFFYILFSFLLSSAFAQNCKLQVSGIVKDNMDTIYPVKNAKILLQTDNGLEMELLSDTNGYYSFCFRKSNFKKITLYIETSRHTASFVNPKHGYLASREMKSFVINDSAKFEHLIKDFSVVRVLACEFRFPPLILN